MSFESITVATAITRIENGELVLPAIQRNFVWRPDRIYSFFDSVMRGYPFGTLLFWNTRARLQYRPFTRDYTEKQRHEYAIKPEGQRGSMVLDGQQRLQSLYIALVGKYEGKRLHIDLLNSGLKDVEVSDRLYICEFLSAKDAADRNGREDVTMLWLPLGEVYACRSQEDVEALVRQVVQQAGLDPYDDAANRIGYNIRAAYQRLKADLLLSHYTIDRNYGDDHEPTPVEEVLEIFVRINSGGQVLSKSDLMFSLLQLHWDEASDRIEDLREEADEAGNFRFSRDFMLRCALVCVGRGARYDVDKLRDSDTIKSIREAFPQVAGAVENTVAFLVEDARIQDERILGSYNTLIPFVYFLFHQPEQRVGSESMVMRMKHALYLSLMTGVFSRFGDSRIDAVIREVLDPVRGAGYDDFPLDEFRAFVGRRGGHDRIDDRLLQNNPLLLMNILEEGTVLPRGKRSHRPEIDHIFPASKLYALGFERDEVDAFPNYRLISKRHNIWKSNLDPQEYFRENPGVAGRYLIPVDLLDYDYYEQFLAVRRKAIWERVQAFLGIPDSLLPVEERILPGEEQAVVVSVERSIRDVIDTVLRDVYGEHYWRQAIPGDVKKHVEERLAAYLARNPGVEDRAPGTPRAKLDYCDVSDYERIILSKQHWPHFEEVFKKRTALRRHLAAFRQFRNSAMHEREMDEVERLTGEAAVIWLRRALEASSQAATDADAESSADDSGVESDVEPTFADYTAVVLRIPVPWGQATLFSALFEAGDAGRTRRELIQVMGRKDLRDLGGVIGALGNRVNRTPGYGAQFKPGTEMLFRYRWQSGDLNLALRPAFREVLTELDPPWLTSRPSTDRDEQWRRQTLLRLKRQERGDSS
jgi:hypothetical protein